MNKKKLSEKKGNTEDRETKTHIVMKLRREKKKDTRRQNEEKQIENRKEKSFSHTLFT